MPRTLKAPGTELRLERFITRGATLGDENPFPPMHKTPRQQVDPNDLAHQRKHSGIRMGYGAGGTLLPYQMQDGYSRNVQRLNLQAVVLENRFLRATFLPELGGRLWSLYHKPARRELLDVNPIIRLSNLAKRDAWFSGGIEWNVCQVAYHTPLTCAPMFAGTTTLADGTPVLRLWEWERRLQIAYQIDAWLPANSPFLRIRFRIHNGHATTLPLYQWSNIAVLETPDTRVIVPAPKAYVNQYDHRGLRTTLEAMPVFEGTDVSYPTKGMSSRDYFFKRNTTRAWISALRQDGRGLIQTSTSRQVGRKLFIWGMATGGRRWQEYLSVPNHAYIEIQAGLGNTQLEGVPMPPGATWDWLEAYGMMEADPRVTHGSNWTKAYTHVERRLNRLLRAPQLERELRATDAMATRPVSTLLTRGSGWGALERKRCEAARLPLPWAPGVAFDDASLAAPQAPWLNLLNHGALPPRPPTAAPGAYLISTPWRKLLERSIARGPSNHWLGWFHLGVMRYDASDSDRPAQRAWQRSLACQPNPWAARGLGAIARRATDLHRALTHYRLAARLLPTNPRLIAEYGEMLRLIGKPRALLTLIRALPPSARKHDRIRLLKAWAALDLNDPDTALAIILGPEFACIREGELSLASIWFRAHELRLARAERLPLDHNLRVRVHRDIPPPRVIDMRMKLGTPEEEVLDEEREQQKLAALRARAARKPR